MLLDCGSGMALTKAARRANHSWASAASSPWSMLALTVLLAFNAIAAQSATFNVASGDKIQDALDSVSPGDTIIISPGNYFENINTMTDGTENARITIKGSERDTVIVRGKANDNTNYLFHVQHDYYTIENFSIDGALESEPQQGADDDDYEDLFRNKLIYAYANREATTRDGGYRSALDGLVITNMVIKNAGGECIRLRYFVTKAEIYDNEILNCGIYDFFYDRGGKNGEGIYVGTSSNQWYKNYNDDPDITLDTHIYDNIIETNGNEGVNVKEGCIGTIIENNKIYMQKDENSGGVDSRGDKSIIRYNLIEDADGAGVRLGGHYKDGYQYGVDNEVYENEIRDCRRFGVKIMEYPQKKICGNTIVLPNGADEDEYEFTGGDYGADYDAREACGDGPSPVPEPTPAPVPEPTPAPVETSTVLYLGCFEDQKGARTMSRGYTDKENLSNEACIEYCRNNGKRFAGTFNKKKCRCTNNESKVDRHGESDNCTKKCPGDNTQICGGKWALSSWRT